MKIKIDENGLLSLERAGKMKPQRCPYKANYSTLEITCGDWCPAFGEPYGTETIFLCLCREVGDELQCKQEDFTDERRKGGD